MLMLISGFYDEVVSDLDAQIETATCLGGKYACLRQINGKNIADFTLEEFAKTVKPRLDAAGLGVSSLGSPIGKMPLYNDEAYAKQTTQLTELVKIANACGCKYIRVFSFYNHGGNFEKVCERLRGFIEIAQTGGVTLIHENEKHIFGDTPERCRKLYDALAGPCFALCYDAGNFIQLGLDPHAAYEQLLDCIVYYHIKDCGKEGTPVPLGMGEARYDLILADLKQSGYGGFLTLEPHTAVYSKLKRVLALCPFAFVVTALRRLRRTFRRIDKKKGVGILQKVSRKTVFEWQYAALTELLGNMD